MKFKKLELESHSKPLYKRLWTPQVRKTTIYATAGALICLLFDSFTRAGSLSSMPMQDIMISLATGAIFGILIINNPCRRGRC